MLRRSALGLVSAFILAAARPAQADEPVKLFTVTTAKDDITIGVTPSELAALGSGEDVTVLAKALASAGQITVWQYAVGRDTTGAMRMNPLRRVAILKTDSLRIAPATTPYKIAPPKS